MTARDHAVPISLAVSILIVGIGGGIAYGQQKGKLAELEGRVERQAQIETQVNANGTATAVLSTKIDNLTKRYDRDSQEIKAALRLIQRTLSPR